MQRILIAFVLAGTLFGPAFTTPAKACSCAIPSDIAAWVDESQAAFVGTLLDRREVGGGPFGQESIFVFEVEEWVKGDAGDVIEVRSASDGAACGLEFWEADNRIGAILYMDGGQLRSDLCSQVDPDVLLAAMAGPTMSLTGTPGLLVAKGWDSSEIDVLDREGGYITSLSPPLRPGDFEGTRMFEACPGGELAVQLTSHGVHVWDLSTLELLVTHGRSVAGSDPTIEAGAIQTISCRDEDAASIYVQFEDERGPRLGEIVSDTVLAELDGWVESFGDEHVLIRSESNFDSVHVLTLATGDITTLIDVSPDENRGVYVDFHPAEPLVGVVEVFYPAVGEPDSRLSVVDIDGTVKSTFEIRGEAQTITWISDERVILRVNDWESAQPNTGIVVDINTGDEVVLERFPGWRAVSDGSMAIGTDGGEILSADLETGDVQTLAVLPTQQAGQVVVLPQSALPASPPPTPEEAGPTDPTTPPLVLEPNVMLVPDDGANTRLIALIAVAVALTGVAWMVWTVLRPGRSSQSDEIE